MASDPPPRARPDRFGGSDLVMEPSRIGLLPLDAEIVRRRLASNDFLLERSLAGTVLTLHFGPEFPGDALDLYPGFFDSTIDEPFVDGSYVVVDIDRGEAVGQVGTIGAPHDAEVEIGYGMNADVHGRGVATAAVAAIVSLLTSGGSVQRVIARAAVANPASGRVLEKNDFHVCGRESSDEGELLVWARCTAVAP
jgi:ribosomal-protein-alanine N-acetyltransferase